MADDPSSCNHFFKFIPPGFKFNLSIPKSFLRNKLKGLRCSKKKLGIVLMRRGDDYNRWEVEISDEWVFGEGWRKFVTDNGVQELDFIVFKHLGNMVFEFCVFDHSTSCERQHYYIPDHDLFNDVDVKEEDQSLTEESAADSLDHTHRHKRLKKVDCKAAKRTTDENYLRRSESKDGDDCSFETIMSTYCLKEATLHVPMKFARSNSLFNKRGNTQIVIMDEARRSWKATLKNTTSTIQLRGWHNLRLANRLKVGDVCKFELVKSGKVPLYNFYKRSKMVNSKVAKRTENYRRESKDGVDFSFVTIMSPYYIEAARLHVPMNFARSNGLFNNTGNTQIVIMDEARRSWTATLNNKTSKIQLRGWRNLMLANHLKVGDVCKFELRKSGKVPLYYFYKVGKKPTNTHVQVKKATSSTRYFTSTVKATSSTRYFTSTIKACNIRKQCLYFPNKFARKNGLFEKEEMIVRNVNGRWWSVEIKKFRNKFCYMQQGWKEFRVANKLHEGEQFKLELVSNGEIPVALFSSV